MGPGHKKNLWFDTKNNWTEDMIFFSTPIWNQPMRFLNEQTSVGGLNHIGSERDFGGNGWDRYVITAVGEKTVI